MFTFVKQVLKNTIMSRGIAALTFLPPVSISVAAGSSFSVDALKGGLNKVAQMQEEETVDGTYTAVRSRLNQPFAISNWDIVVGGTGTTFALTFSSEDVPESESLGRPALSSRRPLDIEIVPGAFTFSVRSALAALNFVLRAEDLVAQSNDGTGVDGTVGDGTFTAIPLRGNTPFETFEWTVTKADNVYTLTATANS